MSNTVLDVRNLSVQFPTQERLVKAVDSISFAIQRGQTIGIVGESGSGKSVTALAVMGLVPQPGNVTGEIWFHDRRSEHPAVDLLRLSSRQLEHYRGGQIAMIFQEPQSSLNPVYTCGFQLVEVLRQHQNLAPTEARRQACSLLQEVKLLPSDEALKAQVLIERQPQLQAPTERDVQQQINRIKQAMLERYPHQLSGGQIQRVMIAIAIACNPALLIADEPTTALDVTVQARILALLRELSDRRQMSLMFITHDLGLVAELADTVAVMYQGQIVEAGPVEQVFAHPQHPYTQGLLACRPSPDYKWRKLPTINDFMEIATTPSGEPHIQSKPLDATRYAQLFQSVSQAELEQRLTMLQQQQPLLVVQDLRVAFPLRGAWGQTQRYVMAVNGVSFEVLPQETLGLVGESGCGKSTLARTLLGLHQPMQGQIQFEGQAVNQLQGAALRQFRRDVQIVFQDPFSSLDPRMRIGDAIMEPLAIHRIEANAKQRQERAAYLLERVGLNSNWMHRYPHEFSGGQRQRICIARSLALKPKLLICDESVSALDVSVQAHVLNLFKELQEEFNLTYIFISHDLNVVKFMSDRILVMNQGKIEEVGPAEQIYHQPTQPYTQQLIAAIPKAAGLVQHSINLS
jgi:peptide/nickel transport system ATP-binding protein